MSVFGDCRVLAFVVVGSAFAIVRWWVFLRLWLWWLVLFDGIAVGVGVFAILQ